MKIATTTNAIVLFNEKYVFQKCANSKQLPGIWQCQNNMVEKKGRTTYVLLSSSQNYYYYYYR